MTEMEVDDESEAIIHHNNLVDVVFSWSFEDVLNKDLYKDKVCVFYFPSEVFIFGHSTL